MVRRPDRPISHPEIRWRHRRARLPLAWHETRGRSLVGFVQGQVSPDCQLWCTGSAVQPLQLQLQEGGMQLRRPPAPGQEMRRARQVGEAAAIQDVTEDQPPPLPCSHLNTPITGRGQGRHLPHVTGGLRHRSVCCLLLLCSNPVSGRG